MDVLVCMPERLAEAMAEIMRDGSVDENPVGVVRSQSGSGSVYASWLTPDGRYGCEEPSLTDCMGLQGAVCKHLLVLVVGLVRTGQLPLEQGLGWIRKARGKGQGACEEHPALRGDLRAVQRRRSGTARLASDRDDS